MKNKKKDTYRILAKDKKMNNNTWVTGINNNDLIIGTSGSGKTRGYVIPNIRQANESIMVADTKGALYNEFKPFLEQKGYEVWLLDFTDMLHSPMGYNILSGIRYDEEDGYNEQDIMTVAKALCPEECLKDPYWDHATCLEMSALIAYVMEALPEDEHHMGSVARLAGIMHERIFDIMMKEWETAAPNSITTQKWRLFCNASSSDKTQACIQLMLGEKLDVFTSKGAKAFVKNPKQIDFKEMGKRKIALFLNVSDTDRAQDKLLNIVYTQALQALCQSADKDYKNHRLNVPVRIILDDFASNTTIPNFDKIISVIRSREIYVSVILQSLTQLYSMYGLERGQTIVNNCDNWLYLGGQDVETAKYIAVKANKSANTILDMPVTDAYLFVRGQPACKVDKYM